MVIFNERVQHAIISCLAYYHCASIRIIRDYVRDSLPFVRVEDVNAGLVDLMNEGYVETFGWGFILKRQ